MILSCHQVCKSFGDVSILKNASFHIEEREKAAVVGINGAGKSTLLKVIVGELSQEFQVSEETIRRDLEKLDKDGLAIKSYGGAVLNENTSLDMPFNVRKKNNPAGKQKIAKLVEGLIEDGDHIILDPSTTAVFIAKALKSKERLTVITNSIEVILELSDTSDWNIISSGGSLREGYLALVGPRAVEGLGAFNVEKAIISCKGLDMKKGITDGNELFSQAKQTMLKSAKQCILAADHTKFDKIAFSRICDVHDIHIVVTDEKPSQEWLELFDRSGIACLYPEEQQ